MQKALDTKKQILEASERLFDYYGFQKTSMADIARECDMSPANIYRFYEGKEEILAEIANNLFRDTEKKLREVLQRPGLSASERLETFIVENLRHLDMICSCHAKIDEAVEYIKSKRPELFNRHVETKRSMVAEILAEGNRSGEFEIEDIIGTAGLILNATFLCRCQWVGRCPPIDEVAQAAKGIIGLFVRGLQRQ
ncbi:MAG: TetR family transcriptional regulator [Proteobacteria bacterium]|nr:TetR family transcriptional regulator [Pseudomonadota bacterium]